jgi:hypothetical protein
VSVKKSLVLVVMAFAVALAVVVGNRMSAEAMAVVIGVVCGVTASIPMSALVLALSRRSRNTSEGETARPQAPIVVVTPGAGMVQPMGNQWPPYGQPYTPAAMPQPREYRVIGDETL